MKVLGIETSCDETAVAVVEEGRLLSNVVFSQLPLHRPFHGVVPELASRAHLQKIAPVIDEALSRADISKADAVAFTQGPGLMGPLLVGKVAAQTLGKLWDCPVLGVNHLEGHVFAVELPMGGKGGELRFPLVALVVSGGHTDLLIVRSPGRYRVLGRTRDDAAGEAYDKVARLLGLGYPGGPVIDRLSKEGDSGAVKFPRPLMPETWDFSFAGLKTSVLYHLQKMEPRSRIEGRGSSPEWRLPRRRAADIGASFQEAVCETLVFKAIRAAEKFRAKQIVLGGGVAANSRLRELLALRARERNIETIMPPPSLCTDNGAMIAQVAIHRLAGKGGSRRGARLRLDPSLPFRNWA